MKIKYVIVLDCGATNVRAVAIDQSGKLKPSNLFPTILKRILVLRVGEFGI